MNPNITNETLDMAKTALNNPIQDSNLLAKTFTQPASAVTGLIAYDLEPTAKHLMPVITPLRNKIARDVSGYSVQANWQVVTAINNANMDIGVSEGNRAGTIDCTTSRKYAAFVELGLENWVTWKADLASKNFIDIKAEAQMQLLWSLMIQEEFNILGGCATAAAALGTTPTPTLTDVGSGGSLANSTTYRVGCVALTLRGYQQIAGWNMGITGQSKTLANGLVQQITRVNMDGSVDTYGNGTAAPSAVATQLTAYASDSIYAIVTPVAGAVAYAWYFGTTDNAHMYLKDVTAENFITIKTTATNTYQTYASLDSADHSYNNLVFDGLIAQITNALTGGYVQNVAGKLTTDSAGGVTQINTALQEMYDQYRLGPQVMYMSSQELLDITKLVIAGGGAPLYRFNIDGNNPGGKISAGVTIGSYLNKITNELIEVAVHPNMPPGTIMLWSDRIPYMLANISTPVKMKLRRDYYSIEWPITKRRYEYGTYLDGVLQMYFPKAYGIINCIQKA